MRSILVLGLLIAACTSASAAHSRPRHHSHSYGAYNSYGSSYGGYGGYDYPNFSYDTESSHNSSQWGGQPD
jgi:hypothetical protein